MESKNLWGELPEYANIKTPYVILREQASLFTKLTKGQLEGSVTTSSDKNSSTIELRIEADLLGYSATILRLKHNNAILYPLNVFSVLESTSYQCNDHSDFESVLKEIFQSEPVRTLIANLLANINAEGR